jgi:predicted small lipoprotein YifL
MLRLPRFNTLIAALLAAALLTACGVKGPLVPPKSAAPAAPPATNAPQIPEPDTSAPARPAP